MTAPVSSTVCSSIDTAISVLGRAWAGMVLQAMLSGHERFTDIRRAIPGITDAALSTRLKDLCDRGLCTRIVEPGPPVSVRYSLTDAGRGTEPVLKALQDYAHEYGTQLH